MRKSAVFKKWFFSYIILIFCIAIFVLIIFNMFSLRMEQDLKNINKSHVEEIKGLFDEKINSINLLSNSIYLTPEFKKLFNADPKLSALDQYNIQEAQKKLKLYDSVMDISKSTSIYLFKPTLFFAGGAVYTTRYLDILSEEEYGLDAKKLLALVTGSYSQYITRLTYITNSSVDKLIYLQSIPSNNINYPSATLIIELNEDVISSYFSPTIKKDKSTIAILNDKNHIIYSTGEKIDLSWADYFRLKNIGSCTVKINGLNYMTIVSKSDKMNWLYMKVIPKDIFMKETAALKNQLMLLIALLLLLGITLAYFLAMRNYSPLSNLAKDIFNNSKDILSGSRIDEYEFIKHQFDYEKEKQFILETRIKKQNSVLKKNFLRNLIKGKFSNINEVAARAKTYDLSFTKDSYAVVVIKINDFSAMSSSESVEKDYVLSTFIIQNIFGEISQSTFDLYDTEDNDLIAYIINFKKDELSSYSEFSNNLENILVETHNNVKDKFEIDFTSIVSNSHETVLGISDAYRECLDALSYTKVLGNTKIIFYQETLQSKAVYSFPIEKEQRIINLIKAADFGNAKQSIKNIILDHRLNKQLSPASIQFLYYDILGTIMKTVTNIEEQELVEKSRPLKSLLGCDRFEEMDYILYDFLYSVCEIKKEKEEISCVDLLNHVREYIIKNLYNPDLNVAMVGDAFNITPAYLSKMFKNETGESILQIINRLRIEKSKALLKDTALSLSEIAEKIGYLYPNTFIRIFKKYEGFTPGQFRKTI